jgi:hypothetical protein
MSGGRKRPQWFLDLMPSLEGLDFSFDVPDSKEVVCSRVLVEFNYIEWSSFDPTRREFSERLLEGIYIERTEYPDARENFNIRYLTFIESDVRINKEHIAFRVWNSLYGQNHPNIRKVTTALEPFILEGRGQMLDDSTYEATLKELRFGEKMIDFIAKNSRVVDDIPF